MAIITVGEYEQILNEALPESLPDLYIASVLDAVSNEVENWCGRSFGVQTVMNEATRAQGVLYNRQPCFRVDVKQVPVSSVSSLAIWYVVGADPTALDVSNVMVEAGGASFLTPFGVFGIWQTFFQIGNVYRARVGYTAGGATPSAVKRAVALLTQETFALDASSSLEGVDDVEQFKIGDYSEKKASRDLTLSSGLGLGTQASISAARLLSSYKLAGLMFL
jgi:hypothetical protein